MNMYSPAKNMEKKSPPAISGGFRTLPSSVGQAKTHNMSMAVSHQAWKEELDPVISFGCWLVHQCLDWI